MELFRKSEGQSLLPNRLVARELKNVQSAAVIKAILYVYVKAGDLSISLNELTSDRAFVTLFSDIAEAKKALAEAVLGKFILALPVGGDTYYFTASEEGYQSYLKATGSRPPQKEVSTAAATPNIYVLYEENIGIMTPLVAQELIRLEEQYPAGWIYDAFRESALQNKKSLKYIMRILENRALNTTSNNKDKYAQGEYGRHVKYK